jgi:hypothetical protein
MDIVEVEMSEREREREREISQARHMTHASNLRYSAGRVQ